MNGKTEKFVLRGLSLVLAGVGAVIFLRYGFPVVLPFVLSYVLSAVIVPAARFLSKKTGINEKVFSVGIIILTCAGILASLWFLCSAGLEELSKAVKTVGGENGPLQKASDKMTDVLKDTNINLDIDGMVNSAITEITGAVTKWAGNVVSAAPGIIFFAVVLVLSLFYFTCDRERIRMETEKLFPKRILDTAGKWSDIGMRALKKFFKVYLSLFGITFGGLTVGFFVIGVEYPLISAFLCAFVDILPVFGIGTVLIPWAAVLFLKGETVKGAGMVVLFLAMYGIRQILEPKLVGNAAGVHPVLALFSVFLGYKIAGVGGMIIAPVMLNAITVFLEEKKKKTLE